MMKMILLVISIIGTSVNSGVGWLKDDTPPRVSIILNGVVVEEFDDPCDDEETGSTRKTPGSIWICVRFYDFDLVGMPRKWWIQFPRQCDGNVS